MNILCSTVMQCYIATEIILLVILLTHRLVQPYRKRWRNAIDITLLTNMLIINTLTIFNYYSFTQGNPEFEANVELILYLQLVLLVLPLVCVVFYMCVCISLYFRSKYCQFTKEESQIESSLQLRFSDGSSIFPPRLLSESGNSTSYGTF